MADNKGTTGSSKLGWLPWLVGALLVMGGLTAVDLAFYRDDIHDEAHEEEGHGEEGVEGILEDGQTDTSDAGEADHADTSEGDADHAETQE